MAAPMTRTELEAALAAGRSFCWATLNERQDFMVHLGGATFRPAREITHEPDHGHRAIKYDRVASARRILEQQGRHFVDNVLVHEAVTLDVITEAVRRQHVSLDNPGFCISCGCEAEGHEPDARKHACDSCGFPGVYGAEELLLNFALG